MASIKASATWKKEETASGEFFWLDVALALVLAGEARDFYELPINQPVRNTSTPPRITWNAACKNGVSM